MPHRVEVYAGVEEEACANLLLDFFEAKRSSSKALTTASEGL